MSNVAHKHHDISDQVWNLLEPDLSGRKGLWGGQAKETITSLSMSLYWLAR